MTKLKRLLAACMLGLSVALAGCTSPALVAGRDYVRLDPPQAAAGTSIEVIEFFWFGCPHCADMHPRVQAWMRTKPDDVTLRFVPVVFSGSWAAGARLHHTLDALGEWEARAGAVFEAVQLDEMDLGDEAALLAWVDRQGLDRSRFLTAYRSPAVQARTAQSDTLARDYQLTGVPSFVVDGRYLTSNRLSGSAPETLWIVDQLIVKVRTERQTRRP